MGLILNLRYPRNLRLYGSSKSWPRSRRKTIEPRLSPWRGSPAAAAATDKTDEEMIHEELSGKFIWPF